MACAGGVHCVTGTGAWVWTSEEPPYGLGWFTSSFAAVLYTRAPIATIAFVLIAQSIIEVVHVIRAWSIAGGGPLDPNPGGIMGLFFGLHPTVEALLISYPLLAIIGAALATVVVIAWETPILLQGWFGQSERRRATGENIWYLRQVKYSLQLVLVAYFPHWIAFGIVASVLGTAKKAELLLIWMSCNIFLIALFWWWNADEIPVVWKTRDGQSPRSRHNRFYLAWAALFVIFWIPIIALCGTSIPSQWRAFFGCGFLFVVLSPQFPKTLRKPFVEGVEPA